MMRPLFENPGREYTPLGIIYRTPGGIYSEPGTDISAPPQSSQSGNYELNCGVELGSAYPHG